MDPITQDFQTFHPFTQLPIEIRLLIWETILRQPRFIQVFLQDYNQVPRPDLQLKYQPGISVPYLTFRSPGPDRCPPLLRVCHESRQLALRSYQICLLVSTTVVDARNNPVRARLETPASSVPRHRLHRWLKTVKPHILPTSHRAGTIRPNHRRYISKGIYFQPLLDTLYFSCRNGGPIFYRGFRKLSLSDFRTDNIQSIAIDNLLFTHGSSAFYHFFNIYDIAGLWQLRGSPPLTNLKRLTIVSHASSCDRERAEVLLARLRYDLLIQGLSDRIELVVKDEDEIEGERI